MRAGCAAASPRELAELGIATRTDRLGNLIATHRGRRRCAERHAVRPHGPARPRRPQDRGERARPRRAARRRAGEGAAVAGRAVLRRRGAGRAGVIANKSHHATAPDEKYRVAALCRALHRRRLRQRRRGARRRHRYRHAGRLRAEGDGARRRPHRRHVGRRPRRLRRHRRGRPRAAATRAASRPCIWCSRCRRSSICAAR